MRRISILLLVFCTCFALTAWSQADPGKLGPYAIGHTSYMLTDNNNGNRPEYFMVWYPVDAGTIPPSTPPAQYPLDPYTGTTYLPISLSTDWESLGYDPAYEGPTPSTDGQFPLVMLSPAFGGDAWMYIFIGTRLASHGYIVAALEPYADCQWPWNPCDDELTVMVNRPRDVSFVITQLLIKNETRGELLFKTIDSDRIAASGHSIGGYATYALAGGDKLVCDALWPVVYGQDTLPYPPNTCVRTFPDHRVKAAISLDGSSQMLRFRELAKISIPSLILGETVENLEEIGDMILPGGGRAMRDYNARPHAAINRFDSYRVDVDGSNHFSYSNYCDGGYVFFNLGIISSDQLTAWETSWPCASAGPDPVTISSADEHLAVTTYMIAFLDVYLHGPDADLRLDREILTEQYALDHTPHVEFFTSEDCEASLPDHTYFSYRPHQVSSECDVAPKDPTGWFASDPQSSNSDLLLRTPTVGLRNLRPPKPF